MFFDLRAIGLEDASGQEVDVAGLHFHQEHVALLIDHHDVDLAMLLKRARAARPVDAVKERVGVGQAALQRREKVEFGILAGVHGDAWWEGGA